MPSEEEFAVTVAQLQALASATLSKPPSLAPTTSTSRFAHLTKTSSSPRSLSALCVHIDCIHSLCESHVIRDYDWSATGLYHALFTCLALLCSGVFVAEEVCDVELQLWRIWSYMISHTLEWHPEAARGAAWHCFFAVKGGDQASNNTAPRSGEGKQGGEQEQAMDVDSACAHSSEDAEDAEAAQDEQEEEQDQFSFEPPVSMPPPIRRRVDGHSGSSSSSSNLAGVQADSVNAVVWRLLGRLTALCTQDPKNVYGAALSGKPAECVQAAQHLFHWLYSVFAEYRPGMRRVLCRSISISTSVPKSKSNANHARASPGVPRISAVDAGSSRLHVAPLLQLLLAIITGLRRDKIAAQVMTCLLVDVLLPLHLPNEMLDWRDQKPAISSYHSVLVQCMLSAINASSRAYGSCSSSLAVTAINGLLSQWPAGFHANSKKEVLLLHELEALVCACHVDEQAIVAEAVLRRVSLNMSNQNDNIFTTQRGLQMFKRAEFLNFLERNLAVAYDILIPAMYVPESGSSSSTHMSWNPTVNRMTGLALQAFRAQDSERFDLACDRLLTNEIEQKKDLSQNTNKESKNVRMSKEMPFIRGKEKEAERGLKRGRGVAVAPIIPSNAAVTSAASVNAAVKAHAIPPRIPLPFPQRQTARSNGQGFNPASKMPAPLQMSTSTGLSSQTQNRVGGPRPMTRAPWATAAAPVDSASSAVVRTHSMEVDEVHKEVTTKTNLHHMEVSKTQQEQEQAHSGRALMQAYIARCIPASSSTSAVEGKDTVADWNVVQASSTPTLLPNLKFHELVFHVGKPLGTGAFSVVKYARHVTPKCSQSDWPEYAVKTISHSVLTSYHYHSSVEREMSILRVLSHPGVCRGISFFRYSSAAYIVLEYCSRGDLHSYIIRRSRYVARNAAENRAGGINGEDDANNELCVSTELARFIVGEITAALLYVHSLGLAYNDLKPENILITKLGHIKISDFGACRAVSDEGRDLLRSASASAGGLGGLRSGGWWGDEGKNSAESNFSATRAEQENTLWAQFPLPSAHAPSETAPSADDFTNSSADTIDNRAEGTPAYLPPEVLQNEISGIPGIASDVWALGCLLLFLLTGRPPFCGDRAAVLEQHLQAGMSSVDVLNTNTSPNIDTECKAVSFKLPQQFALSVHNHASANSTHTAGDAESTPGTIQSLLNGLLRINPQNRFKLSDVAQHEWLVGTAAAAGEGENSGMDPVNLHKSVPPVWPGPWPSLLSGVSSSKGMDNMEADQGEDTGEVGDGEAEDPWARRQYSVLWYAMPTPVEEHPASAAGPSDGSSSKHGGCVPYSLIAVPETDVEHNSPFFVKL